MGRSWRLPVAVACVAAAAGSLVAVLQNGPIGPAVNVGTVLVIGVLLLYGPRRADPMRSTRLLLLGALAVTLGSGLIALAHQAITGHAPTRPWAGDLVAILYAPLTIAGLLAVPPGSKGDGYRARAIADGVLAASSIWYLIASVGTHHIGAGFSGPLGRPFALAFTTGAACVVATAVTVLSRCAPQVRRAVGGLVVGMVAIAATDIWLLVSSVSPETPGPELLYQGGLLALVVAAALPSSRPTDQGKRSPVVDLLLEAAPFTPLLICMVVTTGLIVRGEGIPQPQVLPALLVAVALTGRAYATSGEKQRLLDRLRERETGLEAALRRDTLTGLANRLGLMERLTAALDDSRQWPVAVALLDLNDFKLINDSRGHAVGDELLRQAGLRLAGAVRGTDLVARLGGDEFAVVAAHVSPADGGALAARLLAAFEPALEVAGQRLTVSASIGIVYGTPPATAGELLALADAAMYRGKEERQGLSTVTVLDETGRSDITRQLQLQDAIADPDLDQFRVHYQPLIELATGRIRGFEALLRWTHPQLGAVRPDVFIPLAEQAGSINALGWYVLATATSDLAGLQAEHGASELFVGVNVSPHQLTREDFPASVRNALQLSGLRPQQLMLEVTEEACATHLTAAADTVAALARTGVAIAVDDFGTGYSNLRYLQRLSPAVMKLDRGFLADLATSAETARLVSAVVTMSGSLGLPLVAEGIETAEQRDLLVEMGCELGQGYLFSPAVPLAEASALLGAHTQIAA